MTTCKKAKRRKNRKEDFFFSVKEAAAWAKKAKPCPFCGCDKIMVYTDDRVVVQCRYTKCLAKVHECMTNDPIPDSCKTFKDYLNYLAKKAMEKWNRRV